MALPVQVWIAARLAGPVSVPATGEIGEPASGGSELGCVRDNAVAFFKSDHRRRFMAFANYSAAVPSRQIRPEVYKLPDESLTRDCLGEPYVPGFSDRLAQTGHCQSAWPRGESSVAIPARPQIW